jgi:hypothetical protein
MPIDHAAEYAVADACQLALAGQPSGPRHIDVPPVDPERRMALFEEAACDVGDVFEEPWHGVPKPAFLAPGFSADVPLPDDDEPPDPPAEAYNCPRHGAVGYAQPANQEQADEMFHTFTGHAGGRCTAALLSCGCWDVDESDDLRAAE